MQNIQRNFDKLQKEKLGKYVYALRDPRDKKIFYVGQGINNRVFEHFKEAEQLLNKSNNLFNISSKLIRILDIWKHNEDVEWIILAHNLPNNSNISDYVEAAIVDGLSESQNGDTLNDISPPKSSRLQPEDIKGFAADYINPNISLKCVFVFPIQAVFTGGISSYNATRTSWYVTKNYQKKKNAKAVGLVNSISRGSFEINNWNALEEIKKHEFISLGHPHPKQFAPLLNKNWNKVISIAKGFWQRGNYLVVEFDGKGKFRILRGSSDKNWQNCT